MARRWSCLPTEVEEADARNLQILRLVLAGQKDS